MGFVVCGWGWGQTRGVTWAGLRYSAFRMALTIRMVLVTVPLLTHTCDQTLVKHWLTIRMVLVTVPLLTHTCGQTLVKH